MPDLKKVIKGWECHMEADTLKCADCPYREGWRTCNYADTLYKDVYDLLKEQEAKQAIKQIYHVMMNQDYENPVQVTRYDWLCPNCKSLLCRDVDVIDDNWNFCKVCGQAMKWE